MRPRPGESYAAAESPRGFAALIGSACTLRIGPGTAAASASITGIVVATHDSGVSGFTLTSTH